MDSFFCDQLLDFLPEYIFWKDVNSVYLGCNQNYARLLGFDSPQEIIGKTDLDLPWQPLGHDAQTFRLADQQTMGGEPITSQEEILSLPNGKILVTLVTKRAIKNKRGNVIGILGFFTDITEQKQQAQALKKQAQAANQAKSTFIANMRHGLITPITGLMGMIEMMGEELTSQRGKRAAEDALQSSASLVDLINNIIEISRLESGTLPVYLIRFNLKELANKVIRLVTPAIDAKKLQLIFYYDEALPTYFLSDATRLHRILLNLINNAIKFTEHGEIKLNLSCLKKIDRDVLVKIEVQDTGIGIR